MTEHKKVKDYYDAELARMLSAKITPLYRHFDEKSFVRRVSGQVCDLEYKDRVQAFARELRRHLPENYSEALTILLKILGPENPGETGMFTEGYWLSPVALFVEIYGLDDYTISMHALGEITKRHTSEYAIRPFLEKYPNRSVEQMVLWSKDENFHLRRLASEGMRPRLPWAKKLSAYINEPDPIIPILEGLKRDRVKYVQKSVANCINDILKDNLEIGLALVERWASSNPSGETRWIIKHGLRRLKKMQDPRALDLLECIC